MNKIVFFLALVVIMGCAKNAAVQEQAKIKEGSDNMKLTSPAFKDGGAIPPKHTCQGENISPKLIIADVPKNAKSLALIMDDPDAPAGVWSHWVAWNIPPETKEIEEGASLENEGITDFRKPGYGGPCPPSGTHRYFFKIYALDTSLSLAKATKKELETAMNRHIIAEAQLMGTYKKA